MHNIGSGPALPRRACRHSDARPSRKADSIPLESEIPPRMRGKEALYHVQRYPPGITPAYAGKSRLPYLFVCCLEDHPRVCGEKFLLAERPAGKRGSPPRMRGKDRTTRCMPVYSRITPAYAGKSIESLGDLRSHGDHPRVCGEKLLHTKRYESYQGSPPRMRGKASPP